MLLQCAFLRWGWRPEDTKWVWGEIVSIATLVTTGTVDLTYWATYVGLHPTVTEIHIVQVVATIILWLSGKYQRSPLH